MIEFVCNYRFNDRVYINGDITISATVTGFAFHQRGINVEVSWWNQGELKMSAWVDITRLSPAKRAEDQS